MPAAVAAVLALPAGTRSTSILELFPRHLNRSRLPQGVGMNCGPPHWLLSVAKMMERMEQWMCPQ
eukprot:418898-Pleurochrysis_carterae.AAC.2